MLNIDKTIPADRSNYSITTNRQIKYIVIHYTGGNGTAKANAQYYSGPSRSASAHYFVGHASEGARIYQSVDPKDTAWHCGGAKQYYHPKCRNANSIGIEVCCHNDTADQSASSRSWYFDAATVDRLVDLVKALMAEYNITEDRIVRHYDVTHKICPAPWVHDENAWLAFKARLTEDKNKEFVKTKVAYSEATWAYLDAYQYAKDLYRKWADSYK